MAKCSECGAVVADDLSFCGYCGAVINVIAEQVGTKILGTTEAIMATLSQTVPAESTRLAARVAAGPKADSHLFAVMRESGWTGDEVQASEVR